eukprot:201219_1
MQSTECIIADNQWIVDLLQRKLQYVSGQQSNAYKKGIRNVKNCPYKITNEHNAKAIEGIGSSFGNWIKQKLIQMNKYVKQDENQATKIALQHLQNHKKMQEQEALLLKAKTRKRKTPTKKEKKPYYPRSKTGGYAILIYMFKSLKDNNINEFQKEQLIYNAQKYCNSNSLFSDMSTLIKYDYIKCNNNKNGRIYYLQEAGKQIAAKLYASEFGLPEPSKPNVSIFNSFALNHHYDDDEKDNKYNFKCKLCDKTYVREKSFNEHVKNGHKNGKNVKKRPILLPKYKNNHNIHPILQNQKIEMNQFMNMKPINILGEMYELILLYDNTEERREGNNEQIRLQNEFNNYKQIKSRQYNLPIGDFCWVLKCVNNRKEYLYPIIIERKRMDD